MSEILVQTAILNCSQGSAPTILTTSPKNVMCNSRPVGNIMDYIPIVCIKTFVLCKSNINPAVILIKSATLGTVQQAPCVPALVIPWTPAKPTVLVNNFPILNSQSSVMCTWAGTIKPQFAGQVTVK